MYGVDLLLGVTIKKEREKLNTSVEETTSGDGEGPGGGQQHRESRRPPGARLGARCWGARQRDPEVPAASRQAVQTTPRSPGSRP